jgi:hypothetical protein
MIPDLSLLTRPTSILILVSFPLVLAAFLILSVSVFIKTNKLHGNSEQINKVSELLKFADSIWDSSPDSALVYYNKAILLLQTSSRGKEKSHHLSEFLIRNCELYSAKDYYKTALQDSIAMSLARRQLKGNLMRKPVILEIWGIFLH